MMLNKTDFELKNLKSFEGRDGLCFSVTVYIKGKKAFVATNDGHGGCNFYDPCDLVQGKALLNDAHEFAKSLPPYKFEGWDGEVACDLDILIDELLAEKQERDFFKKKCKNYTLFKLPDAKKGEYLQIKAVYTPSIKAHVLSKHPNAIIINEQF